MNTTPPELPPMTEKVSAAIQQLRRENNSPDMGVGGYFKWTVAIMNAIDAIRESMQQPVADAPAPTDAATLRVDREKVAIAIEQAGTLPNHFSQWTEGYKELRFRQADAAIAAMEYCKKKFAPLRADREKVISEISKIYYDGTLDGERVNRVELMADAAIAAMGAEPVDKRQSYDPPKGTFLELYESAIKERDAARAQCAEMLKELDQLYEREAAFCALANKAPVTRKVYKLESLAAAAKDGAK